MPVEWKLTIVSFKRNEGRCTRGNLLERRLHGHSVRLNWQKTNDFDERAVNSVSIVVNQREDRVAVQDYFLRRTFTDTSQGSK